MTPPSNPLSEAPTCAGALPESRGGCDAGPAPPREVRVRGCRGRTTGRGGARSSGERWCRTSLPPSGCGLELLRELGPMQGEVGLAEATEAGGGPLLADHAAPSGLPATGGKGPLRLWRVGEDRRRARCEAGPPRAGYPRCGTQSRPVLTSVLRSPAPEPNPINARN